MPNAEETNSYKLPKFKLRIINVKGLNNLSWEEKTIE